MPGNMETDFFSIPAAAVIFLRHLLQALKQVMSKTFCPGLQPLLSGNHFNADWFRGIVTCFPVFCMDWIETTNPSLTCFCGNITIFQSGKVVKIPR